MPFFSSTEFPQVHARHRASDATAPRTIRANRDRAHPLDLLIELLLAGLLVFAPFAFGSVGVWSQFIVVCFITGITGVYCLKLLASRDATPVGTWAYLPVTLYIGLVIVQLIPWPAARVGAFSPNTISLRTRLLGDLPDAGDLLKRATITFHVAATRHDLRLIIAAAALFVVIVNTYRRPEQIRRLLVTLSITGALVAIVAWRRT